MKKLFSLASVFLLILVMAGCTSNTTEIEDLQATINQLEIDIAALEEDYTDSNLEVSALQATIDNLNNQITDLQAQIYDNVITFTLTDEYGVFTSQSVGYNEDFTGNLFDILDENFTVGYTESEWGKFIYSLDHLSPKTGAYISFSRNGELSMVGVETSFFEDEDVFSFTKR